MTITHASVAGPLVELTDYQAAHSIAAGTVTVAQLSATGSPGASNFLRGDGSWATPAGGGVTHAYLGYNTIGGSTEAMTNLRTYTKQVTPGSNGLVTSIGFYFNMGAGDHVPGVAVGLWADNSTKPGQLLAFNNTQTPAFLPEAALGTPTSRWIHVPLSYYLTSGTPYWIGLMFLQASGVGTLAYDATGSDQYWTVTGGVWIADGGSLYTITTSANAYSIRADFIVSVTHTYVSAIPDIGDPTVVQASNWNAAHSIANGTVTAAMIASGVVPTNATLTGIFNVKDYGALGDDSHNDTSAITSAIAAIPSTGGTLYFPAGTYKVGSTLTFNKPASLILGAGSEYGGTTIHMSASNTRCWNIAPTLDGTRDQTNLMRGMLIKGPGSASSGEGVYALSDVHLENVGIVGFNDGLFWDSSTFYSRAYGCFFTNNAHAGIKMTNTNNCTIDTCRILGDPGAGGLIGPMQYGIIGGFGSPTGLGIRIVNSSIEYFSLDGISLDGGRVPLIAGNYFETQQSSTGHAHIALGGSTTTYAANIKANYFQGDGTSGFNAIKTDFAQGVTIDSNFFGINAAIGITSTANSSQFLLLNNQYTGSPTLTLPATTIQLDDMTGGTPLSQAQAFTRQLGA